MEIDQEYKVVPIDQLEPHPHNPNKGDVDRIQRSIAGNDWYGVVVVQKHPRRKKLRILAGEHRWKAAQQEGATEIPVVVRKMDDVTALRILLADNETARHATIDLDQQRACLGMLGEIEDSDIEAAGFDIADAVRIIESVDPAERGVDAPPPEEDPRFATQYGVMVVCEDEVDQEIKYNQILAGGVDPTAVRAVSI